MNKITCESFLCLVFGSASLAWVVCLQFWRLNDSRELTTISARVDTPSALLNLIGDSTLNSLGYSNILADRNWLELVQYLGDYEARQKSGYNEGTQTLLATVSLDPLFLDAYLYSTFVLAWKQGKPNEAVSILKKGTNFINPSVNVYSYRLWYQIALLEALWNGDAIAAQQAFNNAANWIESLSFQQRAEADVNLRPKHLRHLGMRFKESPRGIQVRFDIWTQVLYQATTEEMRQLILAEIDALGGVERLPGGEIRLVRPTSAPGEE